jgi:hypothetical protein
MSGDANHPHDSAAEAVSAAPGDHPSDQSPGVGAEGAVLEANPDPGSEGDGASEGGAVSGSREEQLESELQGKSGNVLIEGVYTNGTKAYYGFSLN